MTTSEPTPPNGEEEQRRQQMLEALAEAVDNEDYDFASELSTQQPFLRAFELAEYMDVKRRHSEDPVAARRWEDALKNFLNQLAGVEFPQDEAEVLTGIVSSLEFDSITSNVDFDDSNDTSQEDEEDYEEDDDWENDNFRLELDKETIERVRELAVYQEAERLATGSVYDSPAVDKAIQHVKEYVTGELAETMLKIIDWYTYNVAQKFAIGSIYDTPDLKNAHKTINLYGSDEDVQARMKSALDKYVFKVSEDAAKGNIYEAADYKLAKQLIEEYASNPGRRDAMLRRLGFI